MKSLGLVSVFAVAGFVACAAPSSSDLVEMQSRLERPLDATLACTPANRPEIVAQMLTEQIRPPRYAAGLDLAGDDAWGGLLKSTVDTAYCSGIADGSDDSLSYYIWGSDGNTYPVEAGFNADHKLTFVQINQPYTGTVDFKSRPDGRFGRHTYSMKLHTPILRDGQPFVIDWNSVANRAEAASELTDAMVFTFAAELPAMQASCVQSRRCYTAIFAESETDNGGAVIGARDISFYFHVPRQALTSPPGPSSPDYFYMFPKPARLSAPEPPPPPP